MHQNALIHVKRNARVCPREKARIHVGQHVRHHVRIHVDNMLGGERMPIYMPDFVPFRGSLEVKQLFCITVIVLASCYIVFQHTSFCDAFSFMRCNIPRVRKNTMDYRIYVCMLQIKVGSPEALSVAIREIAEFSTVDVPGFHHLPFSFYSSWIHILSCNSFFLDSYFKKCNSHVPHSSDTQFFQLHDIHETLERS